ncbi:hypothetical protein N7507_006561 [Penicillium longicatenatum]|nr:hypothetical protein N7507_006561 [Penicillium longicatenatum]
MNGTMDRCASPVFETNSSTDVDLELTSSNERESQLSSLFGSLSPSTVGENDIGHVADIAINNGFDFSMDFASLEGFKLTADELKGIDDILEQMPNASPDVFPKLPPSKRTIGLTLEGDDNQFSEALPAPKKRALYATHAPSVVVNTPATMKSSASISSRAMPAVSQVAQASLVMPTGPGAAQPPLSMKPPPPSISSHVMPTVSSPTPASMNSKDKFEIDPTHMAQHFANEVTSTFPPNTDDLSPYQSVGYNPSTPAMHPKVVKLSNETMENRVNLAKQRSAALTADRNKLQKGLLQYTQIDPVTGLLGIDKMKSEMATMRRLLTLAKNRESTEGQIWKSRCAMLAEEYRKLAHRHDALRRQYEPSAPFYATPAYPFALHQQAADINQPVPHQENTNPPTSRHQVIDLTMETNTQPVSAQGTRSPGTHSRKESSSQGNKSFQENNFQPKNNSLTDFHRQFRNKKMDWLQSSETASDVKTRVFEQMSPLREALSTRSLFPIAPRLLNLTMEFDLLWEGNSERP